MTTDKRDGGELDGVLANLALIYRPQASPADQFLRAAEDLIREQERALAESRALLVSAHQGAKEARTDRFRAVRERNAAQARAERLAGALRDMIAALAPLHNAHMPIERELLTDEDVAAAQAAMQSALAALTDQETT